MHICIERENNKCRNIDSDKWPQPVVKKKSVLKNQFVFLLEAWKLTALPVVTRKVDSPASPSAVHILRRWSHINGKPTYIYIWLYTYIYTHLRIAVYLYIIIYQYIIVYVCIDICILIHWCILIYCYIYIYKNKIHIPIYSCIPTHCYICMHILLSTYIHTNMYIYIYVYTYIYKCLYIYIYIHIAHGLLDS